MNAYIRVVNGQIDRVYARDDATLMEYGDASNLRQQAYEKWPGVYWQIEEVGDKKYIVRGEQH